MPRLSVFCVAWWLKRRSRAMGVMVNTLQDFSLYGHLLPLFSPLFRRADTVRRFAISLGVVLGRKFLIAILASPGPNPLYFGLCPFPFPLKPTGKGTGCSSAASASCFG